MADFFRDIDGGAVISTTIDKYCYVTVRHLPCFFDYSTELAYSRIERITDINDINHPLIRNAMKFKNMHDLRITYEADLPARSGLGTSSSFAVGLLNAFSCLKGKYADKKTLADEAVFLERKLCDEAGGWQDQIAASYGGLNRIDFDQSGYTVKPVVMGKERKKELNENLLMYFTGFTRLSSKIQKSNLDDDKTNKKERIKNLKEMLILVDESQKILTDKNINLDEIGKLLDYSWRLKKGTGKKISNDKIDVLYEKGLNAGAIGGKLLGAGGGGFLLFYVPKDKKENVRSEMNNLLEVPFEFENTGSAVIHYDPEDYPIDQIEDLSAMYKDYYREFRKDYFGDLK